MECFLKTSLDTPNKELHSSLMTASEVAGYLGIKEETVYILAKEHLISPVRVCRRLFFRKEMIGHLASKMSTT